MIQIKNLEVSAGEVDIITGISLDFEPGKNYCLLGKNGSGKSTLSSVLMGASCWYLVFNDRRNM